MNSIIALLTALAGVAVLVIPRLFKTSEEKREKRKEEVKDEWDQFYDETNQKH